MVESTSVDPLKDLYSNIDDFTDPFKEKWTEEELGLIAGRAYEYARVTKGKADDGTKGLSVMDRKHNLKTYKDCFRSTDLVEWL